MISIFSALYYTGDFRAIMLYSDEAEILLIRNVSKLFHFFLSDWRTSAFHVIESTTVFIHGQRVFAFYLHLAGLSQGFDNVNGVFNQFPLVGYLSVPCFR